MARLASQAKGGYVPCPTDALDMVMSNLLPPPSGQLHILDPCGGEGHALHYLAQGLGCAPDNTWAIELEEDRSQTIRDTLPGANILAPCSFFSTKIRRECFSLVYCNSPFDDRVYGGGRLETEFLGRSLELLAPRGVLCFIAPEKVVCSHTIQRILLTWCDDIAFAPFPAHVRQFGEVALLAYKRHSMANPDKRPGVGYHAGFKQQYTLPATLGPRGIWEKTAFTDAELLRAINASPLRRHLQPPERRPLPSPPLSLGAGHIALLLASGHLDGLVCPEGEPPHVVRGSAYKEPDVTDVQIEEEGNLTITRETITERIKLFIRVADAAGNIVTLT